MHRLVEQFLFEIQDPPIPARYNIAPSQPVAALRMPDGTTHRQVSMLRWGLIPSWAKDRSIGNKLINARAETVHEKPSFRSAFQHRRCLVLADGYYEWKKLGTSAKKQPYYIKMLDDRPFALAGLYETWQESDGSRLDTCTIITTTANERTCEIHPRMPVILEARDYDQWLDTATFDVECLKNILQPFRSEAMTAYPIDTIVNSPRNDSPDCIVPLAADAPRGDPKDQRELL